MTNKKHQATKWLKICGMGVAVVLQMTTTTFVGDFGLGMSVVLCLAYIALDLCIWYLISVATNPHLGDWTRGVAGVWAVPCLLAGMWTVMSGMAVMAYTKIAADSDAHVIALKGELSNATAAKENAQAQIAYFQQRQIENPNKGVMYGKKIQAHQLKIDASDGKISALNGEIAGIKSEVPGGRDVLYTIIKDARPQTDIKSLKLIILVGFGILVSLTGPLLWAIHSTIKHTPPSAPKGATRGAVTIPPLPTDGNDGGAPEPDGGGRKKISPKGAPEGGGGGRKKTPLKAVPNMSSEGAFQSAKKEIIAGNLKPTTRAIKAKYGIGDAKASPILKRLVNEGVLEHRTTSSNTSSYSLTRRYSAA